MKPLRLELESFGSFPGREVIDFASLAPRGLFVVSGDTGTGKTTIFDAMCWALYGDMPLKDTKDVKSHHSAAETETFVRLTFECGGERYVVTRNPDQLRPAARGSRFAKEPAHAHLERVTDSGTEPVASGSTQTTKECESLVGLDAEQFQRVILLPQGEFTKFLCAGTKDREALLGQLFGGGIFDDIVDHLTADRDELRAQLGDVDANITAQLRNAVHHLQRVAELVQLDLPDDLAERDRDLIEPLISSADAPIAALEREVARLAAVATAAADSHSTATAAAARFTKAAGYRASLKQLDDAEAEVLARRVAAEASAAARPVTAARDTLAAARTTAAGAEARLARRCEEITEAFRSIGAEVDPSTAGGIVAALREQLDRNSAQAAALQKLDESRAAVTSATQTRQELAKKITRLGDEQAADKSRLEVVEAELPGFREQAVDPAGIENAIVTVRSRITDRTALDKVTPQLLRAATAAKEATAEHARVLESFVATQAPRLAATLTDGESCPVCGSREHPIPATSADGEAATFAHVEAASEAKDCAARTVAQFESRCAGLRTGLGSEVDTPLVQLEEQLAAHRQQLTAATNARTRLAALEQEHAELTRRIVQRDVSLAGLTVTSQHADRGLAECNDSLGTATIAAAGLDAAEVARTGGVLAQLTPQCDDVDTLFRQVDVTASAVSTLEQSLRDAIEASPFSTVEAACAALLGIDDEQAHLAAATRHHEARSNAEGALSALVDQGIPDTAPDLDASREESATAEQARNEHSAALTSAKVEHGHCIGALSAHDQLVATSGDSRAQLQRAELAVTVCRNGGPGAEMSLKRWVLTRELDRVTAAANVHLQRMTSSRYTLRRTDSSGDRRRVSGLDLEVIDASTGRGRSTNSLSGGEQFQASLALALGLADVVSHGGAASGKSFDTLFVDEGFGSLDPRSLDEAIDTLHQLHATGRMVGAITHVETMKQQLHVGIEVSRRDDGGGSTLVVHP